MMHATTVFVVQLLAAGAATMTELPDRNIRIENLVAEADRLDEATRKLVVARMPDGARQVEMSAHTAQRLVAARIPGQQYRLGFEGAIVFFGAPASARRGPCFAALQSIPKDALISREDVVAVPCEGRAPSRAVGYDRGSAAPVAAQAVSAGSYLGPIRPIDEERLRRSEATTLVTRSGGVEIRRSVTTLQPGREGRLVFVTTAEGETFAVPFANLQKD